MRLGVRVAVVIALASTTANADPAAIAASSPPPERSRHLVYAEILGKGGHYGIGYEYAITSRLGLGVVGSFVASRGEQLFTAAPYLHATLAGNRRHAVFGEVGLIVGHRRIPSPVPEWDGVADTGAGGIVALGYELRASKLVGRAYVAVAAGEGGVAPFAGLAIGFAP